jgi:hypothetical protein
MAVTIHCMAIPVVTAALCVQVLFMWTILAGYGAVAYLPALVVERPLFVRQAYILLFCIFSAMHGICPIALLENE